MSADDRDYAECAADLNALVHPEHKDLLIYWRERKGDRIAPLRSQFDPLDFHELLPRIAVIEVVDGETGSRFRYRLAGTEIAARGGRDPTGKFFEELYEGSYLETATEIYRGLIASG